MSIPGTSSTVQFVFIDTILLAGITDPTNRSLKPEGPRSRSAADEQWDWINATLVASKADWVIMAGHYPGKNFNGTVTTTSVQLLNLVFN